MHDAERFGHDVLGPIMAEFCLRLWSVVTQMERPDDVAMVFCARGGLRIEMAYERFLASSRLPPPAPTASFMVSRLVALRSSLARTVRTGQPEIGPAAATAISYEFAGHDLGRLTRAISDAVPAGDDRRWLGPAGPRLLGDLLTHADGQAVVAGVTTQAGLFERHLADVLGTRTHAVLVDTGLYGTTGRLLAEGLPATEFSSALIARSYRPGAASDADRSFGLSVAAPHYSPIRRRTALLRYWHFVEWFLEPTLPSVRWFSDVDGTVRSNLEVEDWRSRVAPDPGSAFAGVLRYIDTLPPGPGARIAADADRAWTRFRRAVVWPSRTDGRTLAVGTRSHDFGLDGTWSERSGAGPLAALRGSSMWREGEIARTGSPLRLPLLAAIESAYGLRLVKRAVASRRGPAGRTS